MADKFLYKIKCKFFQLQMQGEGGEQEYTNMIFLLATDIEFRINEAFPKGKS